MATSTPLEPPRHSPADAPSQPSPGPPSAAVGDESTPRADIPAVRFSSAIQEISPTATPKEPSFRVENGCAETTPAHLKGSAPPFHGCPLQERRLTTFQFEAFSLPPSRVNSHEDESAGSSRQPTPISSRGQSPHRSPRISVLASPPLTPSGSDPSGVGEKQPDHKREDRSRSVHDPISITPQTTSSREKATLAPDARPPVLRPASSENALKKSTSADDHKAHRKGLFSVGPGSLPTSRESSPSRSFASNFYSRPMAPGGDVNDPYAKARRPPQQQHPNRHSIDPRFVFNRKKKQGSPRGSRANLVEKRASTFFGGGKGGGGGSGSDDFIADTVHAFGHPGSMVDLRRFFRKPGHHPYTHKQRDASPASSKMGAKTPQGARSTQQLPFGDDHGLSTKYGKLGKVLGSGAGGSVRLMKRKEDGTVFAVKEFRARYSYETEKEYSKKVTAEFCVGSTLHHGNIIETLDILQEKGRWFEVMEYAPFDLFAIVMTGKMTREEVRCCFLQILNGVTYLNSVGLAHRDLKLDNVVFSEKGIMKIIDFGSAHVFRYPFENGSVCAKGIVGSDPYLAPEVYESKEYDAAAVDIWSLAIIFCCMTLRRFPWKIPRMTDNSFKLFAAEPTPGHDPKRLLTPTPSASQSESHSTSAVSADEESKGQGHHQQHHNHHHNNHNNHNHHDSQHSGHSPGHQKPDGAAAETNGHAHSRHKENAPGEPREIIRGPWRILRLLPRESRQIIGRMLDLNPKTRAQMDEILQQLWVADTIICRQLENGEVIPADDHSHVLEPPASQQAAPKT